jgi:hypothetical protein
MSGVVITSRIAGPAVQSVAVRIALRDDQIVNLWYETGCHYIDHLLQQTRKSEVFYTLFTQVIKRESFKRTAISQMFSRIQESPVFWDWWARVLKLICQEFSDSILSRKDLEYYLTNYNALPSGWVIDEIFPKN